MVEISVLILEGVLDMHTLEYIGDPCGHPRSKHSRYPRQSKQLKKIREVLAKKIASRIDDVMDEKAIRRAVNQCGEEMNKEYGPKWRNIY